MHCKMAAGVLISSEGTSMLLAMEVNSFLIFCREDILYYW